MKLLTIIFFSIAIAFSVGAQEVTPNTSPSATAKVGAVSELNSQQKTDSSKQADPQGSPVPTCDGCFNSYPIKQQHTKTKEEESKEASLDHLYRCYLRATVVGVIGGFIGLGILIWQTIISRQAAYAAKASSETVKNSERAWILIKQIGDPPKDWLALVSSEGYTPGIVFEFGVFGNTPVRIADARFILRPVPAKKGLLPTEPDLPEPPDYTGAITDPIVQKRIVLPPTATISIGADLHNLDANGLIELKDGKTILCAYGFLDYVDAFGKDRKTATCYIYNFAWGGVTTSQDGTMLNPPGFKVGGPASYHYTT